MNDLCGLLADEEAASLGASDSPEKGFSTSDGHPQCTWSGDVSLVVGWSEGKKTTDLKTGPDITITPTQVDGVSGVQSKQVGDPTLCQVVVDLPDGLLGASVALQLDGEGKYDECKVAADAMDIIVPKVKDE